MMMKEALINAVKEFFRVVVLAIIPVIIAGAEEGLVDWKVISIVAAVAGLRFLDKLLHEIGVEKSTAKKESALVRGITRF